MRKALKWGLAAGCAAVMLGGAIGWVLAMPGAAVPQPAVDEPQTEAGMQAQLLRHVSAIAGERNWLQREKLEAAATYIESELRGMGYRVIRQEVPSRSGPVRNIEVRLERDAAQAPGGADSRRGIVVIGAHYDSVVNSPAANDNGSGVAVLLELARAFRQSKPGGQFDGVHLVFFVNEEPPYFKTVMMGSWVYAAELAARKQKVAAMYALETMGAYYDAPGTQHYPVPGFSLIYPDKGNFLAFIGTTASNELVQRSVGAFRATRRLPSEAIAAPAAVTGVDWSDHWSFEQHGYPALMVTDTALFRYAYYHLPEDTPDKIDYARLAKATLGLREMFANLYFQGKAGT